MCATRVDPVLTSNLSTEPGYYLRGEFAVRLESIVLVVKADTKVTSRDTYSHTLTITLTHTHSHTHTLTLTHTHTLAHTLTLVRMCKHKHTYIYTRITLILRLI